MKKHLPLLLVLAFPLLVFLHGCPFSGATPQPPPGAPKQEAANDGKKTTAELEAERDDLKAQLAAKTSEVNSSKQAGRERACQWVAGALGLLALLAAVAAYFFPTRRWKLAGFAAFLLGLASASLFIGRLVPYWEYIGAGVVLLGILGGILAWRADNKLGSQVVSAVQDVKERSTDTWAKLKPFLNARTDEGVKSRIGKLVKHLEGLSP